MHITGSQLKYLKSDKKGDTIQKNAGLGEFSLLKTVYMTFYYKLTTVSIFQFE